jgi:hypothetical protein
MDRGAGRDATRAKTGSRVNRQLAAGEDPFAPPAAGRAATAEWRATADRVLAFWTDELVPDPAACIRATICCGRSTTG